MLIVEDLDQTDFLTIWQYRTGKQLEHEDVALEAIDVRGDVPLAVTSARLQVDMHLDYLFGRLD